MDSRSFVAALFLVAVALAITPANAQDTSPPTPQRTECADTFAIRLTATRAAYTRHNQIHPDRPYVQQPASEDVACVEDDRLHRVQLAAPPEGTTREERLAHVIALQEILCYGSDERGCPEALAQIADVRRRAREERSQATTP